MLDLPGALQRLLVHQVDFVLIGGQAAVARGAALLTRDVDICYAREPENLERLAAALNSMHARLRGVDEDLPFILDARTLHNGDSFTFVTDFGSLDVLATPSGTAGYEDLVPASDALDLGESLVVRVVALDDLIRMKRAAGRPKDREAVENLIALRDELTDRGEL